MEGHLLEHGVVGQEEVEVEHQPVLSGLAELELA